MMDYGSENEEVLLSLGLSGDEDQVEVYSESQFGRQQRTISTGWLEQVQVAANQDLDEEDLDKLRDLLLSSEGWEGLRSLVDSTTDWGHVVRLCLKLNDDRLTGIPWEAAFHREHGVTVARSHDRKPEALIQTTSPPAIVAFIHAIPPVGGSLSELSSYVKGGRQLSKVYDDITSTQDRRADVLHFTGHGGTRGGLMVFGDRHASVAGRELPPGKIKELARGLRARLVVIAPCGQPGKHGRWTLAEDLITDSAAAAVVAMREPILDREVERFSRELYKHLTDGEPLDIAVMHARNALRGANWSIPQLHLNVTGDLRVWRKDTAEAAPAPAYTAPSKVTAIRPLPVVRAANRLWQVAGPQGQLTVYEVGPDDLGVQRDRSSVAVSADGRVAAAIDGDELDIGWLVATSRELSLRPLNGDSALQLPTSLHGSNAVILAVTVGADESLRFLVATDVGSFRLTLRWRGAERSPVWEPISRISSKSAQSGFVAAARTVLVTDGALLQVGSRTEVFDGGRAIAMADCAWFGNRRIAAAVTASGEWIRTSSSQDSETWLRQPRRRVAARGVAVVRQVATVGPWLSTEPATPELVYVTNDDQVRLLDADPATAQ